MSRMADVYTQIAERAGLDPTDESALDRIEGAFRAAHGVTVADLIRDTVRILKKGD